MKKLPESIGLTAAEIRAMFQQGTEEFMKSANEAQENGAEFNVQGMITGIMVRCTIEAILDNNARLLADIKEYLAD
jgi:hypothetical protein